MRNDTRRSSQPGHRPNNSSTATSRFGGVNKVLLVACAVLSVTHIVDMMNTQSLLQSSMHDVPDYDDHIRYGSSSTGEPPLSTDDQTFEPIRFIAVGGPYHTGSTVRVKSVLQIATLSIYLINRIISPAYVELP